MYNNCVDRHGQPRILRVLVKKFDSDVTKKSPISLDSQNMALSQPRGFGASPTWDVIYNQ